ncbi:protocatechuate 3,4-dioxygenase subunit alpha [Citrobacter sp. Ct235]|uniref:protocatechuate 3,4-dioxygenase subunit alpha n=1 Tax=Citrobacter sp. Ct235 TaxID=2985157 RepID=UPI002577BBF6|nr:protocatechuate 3,4-dioxygenase subunit alpha [Citrobacter sp. Ct235]MDM2737806.1 protocatechuate 3,4-dioxygenase subunit alpha [Citrobacter sp. Ct235]
MKDYLQETASQTAGPYVHIGLAPDAAGFHIFEKNFSSTLTNSHTEGERIVIEGRVIDGSGTPVRDVLLEIWQANAHGRYNHPADRQEEKPIDADFRGWGRTCSDFDSGVWRFDTIKPGCVVGRDGRTMAPHVNLWIVARGINIGLNTRLYFADEQEANQRDPVLNLIEWEVRRQTLIARREQRGNETVYTFDIHLQGENETVFFDV